MRGLIAFWLGVWLVGCGGTAMGSPDAASESGAGPSMPGECRAWCTLMDTACPEEAFVPAGSCESYCAAAGEAVTVAGLQSDQSGDSWGCRMYWARTAEEASDEESRLAACAAAHASGGGICGTYCELYCDLAAEVCTGRSTIYADRDECESTCAAMGGEEQVLTNVSVSAQHFGYGDTVLCRLHHLQAAAIQDNARLHCTHAAATPDPVTCSDESPPNTVNYCVFASEFCRDYIAEVDSQSECVATLARVAESYREDGFESFQDQSGNTLGCLNYWIMKAPLDPARYCPMADWDPSHWDSAGGAGVCSAAD